MEWFHRISLSVVVILAAWALWAKPAKADDFVGSGTWSAGAQRGTWEAALTRDTNVIAGRVQLKGGRALRADVAGTLIGDKIDFGVVSDGAEIASFAGSISLGRASGTLSMADGPAGSWAGTFQSVRRHEAPIASSRSGAVEPPFDRDSVGVAELSSGDVCELARGRGSAVLSGGGELALRAACGSPALQAQTQSTTSGLISCDNGFPESNPPTPGTVAGDLVNDVSRPLQTWPHITQSETSVAVSLVSQAQQSATYNDSQFLNSQASGIGFGYRTADGYWTENPNQLFMPNGVPGLLISADPSGAGDRPGNLRAAYLSAQFASCIPGACFLDSRIGMSSSTNGGFSYGSPETAINPLSGRLRDKEWLAIDWTTHPTMGNTQYLCWTNVQVCGNTCSKTQIWFARRPPGQAFGAAVAVSSLKIFDPNATPPSLDEVQGCQVAVAPDSSVYVVWWEQVVDPPGSGNVASSILGRRSADGATFGTTFSASGSFTKATDATATTDCGRPAIKGHIRVEPFPSLAANRQTGALYIAYSRKQASGSLGEIAFVRSTNQGTTWSAPLVANDSAAGDKFMPALAHSPRAGKVDIIWYDRRNDVNNVSVDVYRATSTDGGATFGANTRITTAAFGVPRIWPVNFDCVPTDAFNLAACYMGDYIANVNIDPLFRPSEAGGFTQAWGDNSLKFFDPDTNLNVPDPDVRANPGC